MISPFEGGAESAPAVMIKTQFEIKTTIKEMAFRFLETPYIEEKI